MCAINRHSTTSEDSGDINFSRTEAEVRVVDGILHILILWIKNMA